MATAKKQASDPRKVLTPEFRVSFPNVFKPKAFEGQEAKYSITMLFPKKADLSKLKRAAEAAAIEKWGEDKKKWPKNLRTPFRDGSEKDYDGYEGCIFVNASSKTKPGLVDQSVEEIIDESIFYAGCYARAQVMAFAYDRAGNRGISFGLNHVQKLRDGEAFSGRGKAEDVFDAVEDESDDESLYGEEEETDSDDLGF